MTVPASNPKTIAQRALWETTPLAGQKLYVVFWRLRCPSGRTVRKYVAASPMARSGFTENRFAAWKTPSLDEARQRAREIARGTGAEGGHVAEFKP